MTIAPIIRNIIGATSAPTSISRRWRMLQPCQFSGWRILPRCQGKYHGIADLLRTVRLPKPKPLIKRGDHINVVARSDDERHAPQRQYLCHWRNTLPAQVD